MVIAGMKFQRVERKFYVIVECSLSCSNFSKVQSSRMPFASAVEVQ